MGEIMEILDLKFAGVSLWVWVWYRLRLLVSRKRILRNPRMDGGKSPDKGGGKSPGQK